MIAFVLSELRSEPGRLRAAEGVLAAMQVCAATAVIIACIAAVFGG